MRKLRAFWIRLAGLLGSGSADHDFSDELESHIAMHVDYGVRSGLSPEQARRRALIQLGWRRAGSPITPRAPHTAMA